MPDDFQRDVRFYRYAQLATAYTFTKAMIDAGVDSELILDVNWIANTEWAGIMERFEELMTNTPATTRDELADLEYTDLADLFDKLDDLVNGDLEDRRSEEE